MEQQPKKTTGESDGKLIAAIKSGSEDAFEEFVSRYEDMIYGFGMKVCGNTEDARDIMQDTFLKAFRSIKNLKNVEALKGWLYRIATNACLIRRRKGKFEPQRIMSLDELRPSREEISGSVVSKIHLRPDEAMLQKELSEAIKKCILQIPQKYRIVLILRDMEGFSAEDAGKILNLPVSTIKIRLHRARLSFKKYLEKYLRIKKRKKNGKVQAAGKM